MGFADVSSLFMIEAWYTVAYRVAQQKKPHTMTENLIRSCAMEMAEANLGKKDKYKGVLNQMIPKIKKSAFPFALQ